MNLQLEGRVVLVTGGSSGLGAAAALRLVNEGAKVAICGRDGDRLDAAARKLSNGPGEVLAVKADVTRSEDVQEFVESAHQRWGRLDGLLNNAGSGAARLFEDITDSDWDADLDLKLHGAIRTTRAALPLLRETGGGAIVNVLAIAAKTPGAGSMPSSVSRAAGLALTKALSKEVAADHIRVNAVLVGVIRAGGHDRRAESLGIPADQYYAELARTRNVPLGRVGRDEEFADLVAYLVSERSSYVTGTAINIDGGASPVP
jgi:NAD(P)-dependent dehydrogenase (short-subunit alcohol dehydrogenase family)